MLAKLANQPFSNDDWIFEIKWDGFRAIAYINHTLSLRSRNGKELRSLFPELEELEQLTSNAVLDGEIVVMKDGKTNFQALLKRSQATSLLEISLKAKRFPAVYIAFDILEKDDVTLVDLPLTERKKILRKSVREGNHVLLSDSVVGKGEEYYKAALKRGLEGLIAKRKDSTYVQGARDGSWLKIKKLRSCDCIVIGYTKGSGSRSDTFGALLLGLYNNNRLVYIGKVGTGFSQRKLKTLWKTFQQLRTNIPLIGQHLSDEIKWLKPELVCEVLYQTVTNDGRLRMPRFMRLRNDRMPSECTMDQIANDSLYEYLSKRDFSATTEPVGGEKESKNKIFVVQEHHSRRLHYDLRLEKDGVLKSWAIPKGMPSSTNKKRLAVETEDHPLGYANFEGEIPEGQYGAGVVKIWDEGNYDLKTWEENIVEFTLKGKKLRGRYILVRLKKAGKKNWLLLKGKE